MKYKFNFNNIGGKTNNPKLAFIEFAHKNALNMPLRVVIDPSRRPPPIKLSALLHVSVYRLCLYDIVIGVVTNIIIYYIIQRLKKYQQKITNIIVTYLIAPLMKLDMTAMPIPLPDTMNISTNSRFRLKYCATISVEQSLVMPTPIPETDTRQTNRFKHFFL